MIRTSIAAALAAFAVAGVATAQTETATPAPATPPAAQTPPVNPPTTPAAPAEAPGASAAAPASVAVGLTVKDNTGLAIGQVTEIKPDASGKSMATIAMGADKFAVDASSLGVADGVATINLTAAQIEAMLRPTAAPTTAP